jgi:hypothetical protein
MSFFSHSLEQFQQTLKSPRSLPSRASFRMDGTPVVPTLTPSSPKGKLGISRELVVMSKSCAHV